MKMTAADPREHFHPLEIIPFFRRWPCSPLRDLVYTVIWSCLFGLGFFILDVLGAQRFPGWAAFATYLFISTTIGFAIHGLYWLGDRSGMEAVARGSGFWWKVLYFAAIPILGVAIGMAVSSVLLGMPLVDWLSRPGTVFSIALISLLISLVLSVIFFWRERAAHAEAAIERERARSEGIERQAVVGQLRALQAQIEPHFLFNTLANVTTLIDPDPAAAKRMLESFIRFLRSSLAATRAESTTLGEEAELIASYLDVLQIRMGARLRYAIDIPPGLRGFSLPPMLLQPIVENAIRHGLEPKVEGGEVALAARREGERVRIDVTDTGAGFGAATRGGVGLTNIRERLRLLYGDAGRLEIADNAAGGARVTLTVPA